jgi:hypothetical protein
MSYEDQPDFLTIPEAASLLRLSRGAAYAAARLFRESGGQHGLPVVRIGRRSYRVPKAAILRFQDTDEIRRLIRLGEPGPGWPPAA